MEEKRLMDKNTIIVYLLYVTYTIVPFKDGMANVLCYLL